MLSLKPFLIEQIERTPNRAITFADYMAHCLYHPHDGYYQRRKQKLGKQGDFYTNAHVGDIYGEVLSRFFWKQLASHTRLKDWTIVEVGAGDGRLVAQLIAGFAHLGGAIDDVQIYLVETSPYHRAVQQAYLAKLGAQIKWVEKIADIPQNTYSFIYSNELLDAMPVHRLKQEKGQLKAVYVTYDQQYDDWQEVWLSAPSICHDRLEALGVSLAEGEEIEFSTQALEWLETAYHWMERGAICTIDYGLTHQSSSIRAYRDHQLIDDWYRYPGEVDLTYNVNFEFLEKWGERLGLTTLLSKSQSQFLLEAGILKWMLHEGVRDPFSPEAKRNRAITQLIHPDTMGDRFHVLWQGKNLKFLKEEG
ncbi:SAM-dependent methyltransferase [Hazenella sp. IB182357]|uniref:SAM-dependent methyltransferase n=1 Tax=Polycladospora coralii TaxID=2771432 RepID=A0A926RTF8_9BACL|nr:SAM-dependent methyltransferase [Polycladospora coralii]MBD1371297.1 SAM-dependent methyltransferase [Polycladospora coralii]